jgi:hypothetical protein
MFEEAANTLSVELYENSDRFWMLLQKLSNCEVINAKITHQLDYN